MRCKIAALLLSILAACPAGCAEEASMSQSQSFTRARMLIEARRLVPASEIRVDEWINYQRYDFPRMDTAGGERLALWAAAQRLPDRAAGPSALMMIAARTAPNESQRKQPVDLMIVLDRSGSMEADNRMGFAQEGIRALTSMLQPGDRVGLLGFDNLLYPERNLTPWRDGDSLDAELLRLLPKGGTDLNLGLTEGMRQLAAAVPVESDLGKARTKRLLVITDAQTNQGQTNIDEIEKALAPGFAAGIRMSCIGVGLTYNDALFSRLCRIPGNNGRFLDKPSEIRKSMVHIFDALVPLEIDKPRMAFTLPDGIKIARSFGTPFEQRGTSVTFEKLTSLGADDHEIICLELTGSADALDRLAGVSIHMEGFSPARGATLKLDCAVHSARIGAAPTDDTEGRLADALNKAAAVAGVGEWMRAAARAAESNDLAAAKRAMDRAEKTMKYFGTAKDAEVEAIRELVRLNREVLDGLALAAGTKE